jgi:hypothetical protein
MAQQERRRPKPLADLLAPKAVPQDLLGLVKAALDRLEGRVHQRRV